MLRNDQEIQLIELLAQMYCKIPWGKMKTAKNPHDIFNHRVRAAARRATLYECISRLANMFGMQTIPVETQAVLDALRPHEVAVLNALSQEHIPLCVRAIIRAKEIKFTRKEALDDRKI
jgi:hypothetical protein